MYLLVHKMCVLSRREIFNDFCEMFHDLEENVKDQVMVEIEKVLLPNRSPPQCHSADGSSRRYEEPQNSGELESSESYSCLNKDEQFHICMDEAGGLEKENEEQYEEEMALLQSLLPDLEIHARVKREFLLNELKESNYNIQVAADKILDNPKIEADIAAWRNRQKPDRETSPIHQVDPGLKKSIVSKYHLQPVPSGTENGKANSKMKVSLYEDDEKDGGKGRVRFRENVVVSNKGEKYIIEKPPEWDGGSRGKVKSKRKGGKGFY